MNANLYALLRSHFAEHLEQPCVLIPGGPVIHYDDLDAAVGAHRARVARRRLRARRSRRRADRQMLAGAGGLPGLPARGPGVPAAQHRVSQGRARLFLWRCRTARHRVRSRRCRRDRCAAHRRDGADPCGRRRQPARSRSRPPGGVRHRDLGPGRSRGAALHLGDDRPLEGRDADAPQPGHQRAGSGRTLGLYARRRVAARLAAVSRARPVRRLPLRAAVGQPDAVAAEIRRRGSGEALAARDGDDGRPDLLLAPACRPRVRRRGLPHDPRVHLRLGAAAAGNVQRLCRAYRTGDRRALRHDRNRA